MATDASSLDFPVDVMDRVLDKGIVIDAAVRIAVAGVEVLGVDARVVVASIETYLRHADTIAYTDMAAAPARVLPAATLSPLVPPAPLSPPAPLAPSPPLFAEPVSHDAPEPGPDRSEGGSREATPPESVAGPPMAAEPAAPDTADGFRDGPDRTPAD